VPLLGDRARIDAMAAAAASVGRRDGTDRMVALVDTALGEGAGDTARNA
jgi:UDP-N-acetylglucosamine--N-acetylmuramyl-(pentapeptide) pyrophosphoryl-undecaprenol N-acetylglucosamine transferase